MPNHVTNSMIFRDFYGTPEMRAIFDDAHLVRCWLDVEAALARAQANLGIIPDAAAVEIKRVALAEAIDLDALREGTVLVGYPILPLVRQLAALCEGEAGRYVHWGATTQDIMDTALALRLRISSLRPSVTPSLASPATTGRRLRLGCTRRRRGSVW